MPEGLRGYTGSMSFRALSAGLLALALAAGCRQRVVETAPDLGVPSFTQGRTEPLRALSDLRPNVVVLEFWATWCGPCRKTLPHMNKLVQEFEGKPVRFIAVTNETPDLVNEFLKEYPMKAWVGIDPKGELSKAFRIRGIPQVVVIDPYGRIQVKVSTSFFYASDVERALEAEAPRPSAAAK